MKSVYDYKGDVSVQVSGACEEIKELIGRDGNENHVIYYAEMIIELTKFKINMGKHFEELTQQVD